MTTSDPLQTSHLLPLIPGRWELDQLHTTVGFTIRHLGVSKVRGRFDRVEADVVIGDRPETSSLAARVDLASVDTGQADRDTHIRAADMLDVANRPTMTFRSTTVTGAGDDWAVAGDLTIGDITRPVTLALELGGVAEIPGHDARHAGIMASGELRRSEYGIAPGIPAPMLGEVVKIEIDLELIEPR